MAKASDKLCAARSTCRRSGSVQNDESGDGFMAVAAGDTSKTPTVCDPINNGTDKAAAPVRGGDWEEEDDDDDEGTSQKTSSARPTPAAEDDDDDDDAVLVVVADDTMGYPGNNLVACAKPGNLVKRGGKVGATPESACEAIKTRSRSGGGYKTDGMNSNCPVCTFSCGKYKAMDLTLEVNVVAPAYEDGDDADADANGCNRAPASNSNWD